MSFHHVSKGFFPGAGQCSETGAGNGRDYNLNIPLKEGEALQPVEDVPITPRHVLAEEVRHDVSRLSSFHLIALLDVLARKEGDQ